VKQRGKIKLLYQISTDMVFETPDRRGVPRRGGCGTKRWGGLPVKESGKPMGQFLSCFCRKRAGKCEKGLGTGGKTKTWKRFAVPRRVWGGGGGGLGGNRIRGIVAKEKTETSTKTKTEGKS